MVQRPALAAFPRHHEALSPIRRLAKDPCQAVTAIFWRTTEHEHHPSLCLKVPRLLEGTGLRHLVRVHLSADLADEDQAYPLAVSLGMEGTKHSPHLVATVVMHATDLLDVVHVDDLAPSICQRHKTLDNI